MARLLGIIILLAGGVASYFSIDCVLWQDRANRRFVSAPADVVSAELKSSRSRRSTSYWPAVTYRYPFGGRDYQSTRVLAFSESRGRAWAVSILSQITGQAGVKLRLGGPAMGGFKTVAYVDPERPEDSVLLRRYSFMPYVLALASLLLAGTGAGMAAGVLARARGNMTAIALDPSEWRLLLPAQSLRKRFWDSVCWLAGIAAISLVVLGHYVMIAGQWDVVVEFAGGICAAAILVLGAIVIRRWLVSRHVSDVRLRVCPAPVRRGEVCKIEAEADAYSVLAVQEISAKVVCLEHYRERRGNKTYSGTRTKAQRHVELAGHSRVAAGSEVSGQGELFLGEGEAPPTTDRPLGRPYYTWEVRLKIKLEGMVDYSAVFPVEVK